MKQEYTQLYYEDIQVGMEIPSLSKGPISMTTVVKFAGASGDFAPIHHDVEVAKMRGLPGPIVMGPLLWAHLSRWLVNWARPAGVLHELNLKLSDMTPVGDTVIAKGKVCAKSVTEGKNAIQCEISLENTRTGRPSISGTATLYFPSKK